MKGEREERDLILTIFQGCCSEVKGFFMEDEFRMPLWLMVIFVQL